MKSKYGDEGNDYVCDVVVRVRREIGVKSG